MGVGRWSATKPKHARPSTFARRLRPPPSSPARGEGSRCVSGDGIASAVSAQRLRHRARILGAAASGRGARRRAGGSRSTSSPPRPRSAISDGELGGEQCGAFGAASTTMRASRGGSGSRAQPLPFVGDAAVRVEASRSRSSAFASASAGARRRIEEGSAARVGDAPGGEVEREAGKIRGEDLGRAIGASAAVCGLVPQPVADARLGAAGAAAALVGRRARDAHGLEPRQRRHRGS